MVVYEIKVLLFRPAGKAPTFFAVSVTDGAIRVPDHKNKGNLIAPTIIIRMSLPPVIIGRAGVTPIAIIPPSGKSLSPGRTMVSNSIIGANTLAAAQISAQPTKKGQSKPILSVRPFNLFGARSVIPWDKGPTAAINQVPTKENSSRQTAAVKDRGKICVGA